MSDLQAYLFLEVNVWSMHFEDKIFLENEKINITYECAGCGMETDFISWGGMFSLFVVSSTFGAAKYKSTFNISLDIEVKTVVSRTCV